ncbi:hypothetical protein EV421DRAFT_2021094 [Armillaria borealis]|uniref:Uncharacterized protein n=1 Tax=Armillaria borealis TaxID=47425 RepID=A0AA39JCE6_9AGAR|nr:hypothetical protein EV421DRAFT_2021094 [Armillaria borealis]
MYLESYLLCQLTCAREARRRASKRMSVHTRRGGSAGSAEHHYTRGARREIDLHRIRPVRRRVDGTTRMVGPAWDFWVYSPSITMIIHMIQTEQDLACSAESRRTRRGEDGVRGGTCMREGHTRRRAFSWRKEGVGVSAGGYRDERYYGGRVGMQMGVGRGGERRQTRGGHRSGTA